MMILEVAGTMYAVRGVMLESVADVLIVENDKILLVQQKQQSAYGLWGFPGGHLEPGETPQEAVVREIHEELGVELIQTEPFKVTRIQMASGELELNSFTGTLRGSIVLQDDELMAYGWFSFESLQIMQDCQGPHILDTQSLPEVANLLT